MKGGSINKKEKIIRKDYDDKASLYCSQFKKELETQYSIRVLVIINVLSLIKFKPNFKLY